MFALFPGPLEKLAASMSCRCRPLFFQRLPIQAKPLPAELSTPSSRRRRGGGPGRRRRGTE